MKQKILPHLIRVVILISLMLGSITLSACVGSTIETVENKKSIHEQQVDNDTNASKLGKMQGFESIKIPEDKKFRYIQQEETFQNSKKDITDNDNNARNQRTRMESFERTRIVPPIETLEHTKSRHEQQEENFHRKVNRVKDIIDNKTKQDPLHRNNSPSFPTPHAF